MYKPKEANITKKTLRQCWDANPDSAGFMFAANNNLIIHKGYTVFKIFYKAFRKQEKQHCENFVLHFRIATHGKVNEANCHPFVVNKNIGFVHNGILNCVVATANKSDTFVFCKQVLQKLPSNFLNRTEYRVLLESVCKTESSKFTFLTNKGTAHIFNEAAGTWQNGCWFSNEYFIPVDKSDYLSIGSAWQTGKQNLDTEYAECYWCGDYYPIKQHISCCETCVQESEKDKIPSDNDYLW